MSSNRRCEAPVSILDLKECYLTSSDIQEPVVITTPGSNVHMQAEPLLGLCEYQQGSDNVGISVKTFMSQQRSFGNVGFYEQCFPVPYECSNTSIVKYYTVTVILQERGKPYAKFNGILQMWRSDMLVRLLLSSNSRRAVYPKEGKDNAHSKKFFTRVRNFLTGQTQQTMTKTEFENLNISVHIELVSLYLTDLCSRGLFPPTPNAGHTHFTLPSTVPITFYPHQEIVWNSVMRLLSFLYAPNENNLYPVIARAGFYLVDQNFCCSECDCLCSLSDFEEGGGQQSEFDKHHKLGCMHRHNRVEDCKLPQRKSKIKVETQDHKSQTDFSSHQSTPDCVSYQSGKGVISIRHVNSNNFERQSESMATQECIGKKDRDIWRQRSRSSTTSGTQDKQASFDDRHHASDVKSKEYKEPMSPGVMSRRNRNDTLLSLNLTLQLRKSLVQNGFFYDGFDVRCCCCMVIFKIPSNKDPSQVHAQENPGCQFPIYENHKQKVDRSSDV